MASCCEEEVRLTDGCRRNSRGQGVNILERQQGVNSAVPSRKLAMHKPRHVSFEGDLPATTTSDLPGSRNTHESRDHSSESLGPVIEFVRNIHAESPIFVRRDKLERFRKSSSKLSLDSRAEMTSSMMPEQRHPSASTLSSYVCLPAVTLPATNSAKKDYFYLNRASLSSEDYRPKNSRQRQKLYGERKMSAFEVLAQHMSRHKETCQQRFCNILVLLVILQISLGLSIVAMAIYLTLTTSAVSFRDATVWSGVPLAVAGFTSAWYDVEYRRVFNSLTPKAHRHRIIFTVFSCVSTAACTVACITSGMRGTQISRYKYPCVRKDDSRCTCYEESSPLDTESNDTSNELAVAEVMEFPNCSQPYGCCDLIFTNIKDCLIMECAFNFIGVCVSVWLMVILWKNNCRYNEDDEEPG